ncbi:hypothetical protein IEO21_07326 [Rhodonia placenta]|uniref:Uncharacterized protein n=1 Tax=Rhodonia placenta TaxID=104341 RepID=A0A8H7TZS0_9APHY|nr:hypothetical protein IEO21_07326 [Postia placenta]
MIYLVACILERLFGPDTIDEIEAIRGDLTIPEIIDGVSRPSAEQVSGAPAAVVTPVAMSGVTPASDDVATLNGGAETSASSVHTAANSAQPAPSGSISSSSLFAHSAAPSASSLGNAPSNVPSAPAPKPVTSAFGNLQSTPNAFGSSTAFGVAASTSAFSSSTSESKSNFATPLGSSSAPTSIFAASQPVASVFNGPIFPSSSSSPFPAGSSTVFGPSKPAAPIVSSAGSSNHNTLPSSVSQPSTSLNPSAPMFAPASAKPLSTTTSNLFPTTHQSSVLATPLAPAANNNSWPTAPQIPSSAATSQPLASTSNIFSPQAPQSTQSHPTPSTSKAHDEKASPTPYTPRIVDRSQTLWDVPGDPSLRKKAAQDQLQLSISVAGSSSDVQSAPSPVAPPPLGRIQPLSLPPTPTERSFETIPQSASRKLSPQKKKSLLGFFALQPTSPTSAEILSPLQLSSPGGSKLFSAPENSPTPQQRAGSPSVLVESPTRATISQSASDATRRTPARPKTNAEITILNTRAAEYRNGHPFRLLRMAWRAWFRRSTGNGLTPDQYFARNAAWNESCNRSIQYADNVQRQRMSSSFSTGSIASKPRQEQNKRRRVSTMESSQAKRSRRRVAGINVQPLNDEDLLRRLKEVQRLFLSLDGDLARIHNHEEHKRRWAQGSFLRSIRIRVRSSSPKGRPHIQWRTWLSLNPENDGTAIWLEHKFDVPSSGSWDSETVFSIPAIPDPKGVRSRGSPGLIVFERTPLEDLPDEIERKYRILDDCSRLRDIIDSLPQDEDLRFIPSLLVIDWVDSSEGSQAAVDFVTMTEKLVSDGIIKGVSTLTVSTKMSDPDGKMVDILNSMPLDVEDRFVVSISWEDLTNRFLLLFKEAVSEWLDSCWNGDKR